jgi:hypothetical protein
MGALVRRGRRRDRLGVQQVHRNQAPRRRLGAGGQQQGRQRRGEASTRRIKLD